MRIAVFVEHLPPYMGSDKRIFELMKRIADNNEIHFIVFPSVRSLTNKKNIDKKTEIDDANNTKIIGHFIHFPSILTKLWTMDFKIGYLLSSPYLLYKTVLIFKNINPDVVILNYPSPYTGLIGLLASKISRKPVILDFDDLIAQYTIILFNLKQDGLVGKSLIKIQNTIAKNCDEVVVITSFIKSYCLRIGIDSKKITVISNGADFKSFSRYIQKKHMNSSFTCAYIGNIEGWAGMNIIKRMAKLDMSIQYIVAGTGDSKNVPKNVNMLGYVPPDEVPEVLSKADCVLVPFPFNEMTNAISPLKLIEAMAASRPIIASGISGIKDVITSCKNGILVDSEDPSEWLKAVKELQINKGLRERIARDAYKTAKNYDWELLASRFEDVFIGQKAPDLVYHRKHEKSGAIELIE